MAGKRLIFLGLVLMIMSLACMAEDATERQPAEIQDSAHEEGSVVGEKLHVPGFHLPGHGHRHRRCCKRFGPKCIHYCDENEWIPVDASPLSKDLEGDDGKGFETKVKVKRTIGHGRVENRQWMKHQWEWGTQYPTWRSEYPVNTKGGVRNLKSYMVGTWSATIVPFYIHFYANKGRIRIEFGTSILSYPAASCEPSSMYYQMVFGIMFHGLVTQ